MFLFGVGVVGIGFEGVVWVLVVGVVGKGCWVLEVGGSWGVVVVVVLVGCIWGWIGGWIGCVGCIGGGVG